MQVNNLFKSQTLDKLAYVSVIEFEGTITLTSFSYIAGRTWQEHFDNKDLAIKVAELVSTRAA